MCVHFVLDHICLYDRTSMKCSLNYCYFWVEPLLTVHVQISRGKIKTIEFKIDLPHVDPDQSKTRILTLSACISIEHTELYQFLFSVHWNSHPNSLLVSNSAWKNLLTIIFFNTFIAEVNYGTSPGVNQPKVNWFISGICHAKPRNLQELYFVEHSASEPPTHTLVLGHDHFLNCPLNQTLPRSWFLRIFLVWSVGKIVSYLF